MDDLEFIAKAFLGSRQMVARLDIEKGVLRFIKWEDESFPLGEPMELAAFVKKYLKNGEVYPDDKGKFQLLLNQEQLRDKCVRRESGSLFSYRRVTAEGIIWYRVKLVIPEELSPEQPEVLLCCRRMSQNEADVQDIIRAVDEKLRKVIKLDPTRGISRVVRLRDMEENTRQYSGKYGSVDGRAEEEFVYPGDLEEFHAETAYNSLIAYFQAGNTEKTIYYRRKAGSLYRWVRLVICPASEYTPEHPVLLYRIEDVHRSLVSFFAKQGNTAFVKKYKKTNEGISAFYENTLNALSFFTQKYLDFCVIDLERDMYIKYKVDQGVVKGSVPYVGTYSKLFTSLIPEDRKEDLQIYATAPRLRKIMTTKISADFSVRMENGEMAKVIFTRLEMMDNVPTKVICRVVRQDREGLLRVKTFGSFEVYDGQQRPIRFTKKKSRQLLAYLVDHHGHTVSTADIVADVLEKPENDLNAKKYVSTLIKMAGRDLEQAGYTDIILKEWNAARVNVDKLDCDYYHLIEGDTSYWQYYHNEYMKDYRWAEKTNAELLRSGIL